MNSPKTRLFALLAFATLLVSGCMTPQPQKTSLELQAFEKKEFATTKEIAFASTVSVFQDYGYIIHSADLATGLISAQSPTKSYSLFGVHMENTEASAFVESLGANRATIRLNFVQVHQSSSTYGMNSKDEEPIEEPKIYQDAFQKIQEAVFIRSNTN